MLTILFEVFHKYFIVYNVLIGCDVVLEALLFLNTSKTTVE